MSTQQEQLHNLIGWTEVEEKEIERIMEESGVEYSKTYSPARIAAIQKMQRRRNGLRHDN
jgi:hypothetical protein